MGAYFKEFKPEYLLFESGSIQCFVIPGDCLGSILFEIGRIRESVLRKSLYGSGKDHDLDGVDQYYHHVIVWDSDKKNIMGGYRFRSNTHWLPESIINESYLEKCYPGIYAEFSKRCIFVELGRSFIDEQYQNGVFSLFLLWKGVLTYLAQNFEVLPVIVGVPWIKLDDLSEESGTFLLDVLSNPYFYEPIDAVKAKFPFQKNRSTPELYQLAQEQKNMATTFNIINNNEGKTHSVNVLLKQYINVMSAKTHGFSVSPDFNNLLEVLMSSDMSKIPKRKIERYINR